MFCINNCWGFEAMVYVQLGFSSDAEVLSMCDTCSGVVDDLSDLQELLESTQNAIRDKILWMKEILRSEKEKTRSSAEINEEVHLKVNPSAIVCAMQSSSSHEAVKLFEHAIRENESSTVPTHPSDTILSSTHEMHEDVPVFKKESDDFELNSAILGDFIDDFIFEPVNEFVRDDLADSCGPKRRKGKLDREDKMDEEFKLDKKLLKFHGLDKLPLPHVSLQRIDNGKSNYLATNGRSKRPRGHAHGTKLTVIEADYKNVISAASTQTYEVPEPDESDEYETGKVQDEDNDPDFIPSVASDTDAGIRKGRKTAYVISKSRFRKKSVSERRKKKETDTAERSRLNSSTISFKKRRVRLNQDISIVIKDGKMMLGTQEIVEEDNSFLCCYDTCTFKMTKAETEIDSSKKMLNHLTVKHMGCGQYECRKCHLRFKDRYDYQKHFSHQHGSGLPNRKLGQSGVNSHSRSECKDCGKPLLISGIYRHQWSHKSEEEKRQWLAEGRQAEPYGT